MGTSTRLSRRSFLTGRQPGRAVPPRPPGVTAASVMACTGCGECVDACPEQVLTIAEGRVALEMAAGECTFCGTCSDACPESVFTAGAGMAHEMILGDDCLARNGVSCMTCRDACPEEAITVRPRIGGPFLPVLDPALCSGCGACVGPCPAGAITPQIREPADA